MSHLVLVITDQESNAQIKSLGVALLEIRTDLFKKLDPSYIVDQIKHRKLLKTPLLLTVRNQKQEGAIKNFSDDQKWQIITTALPLVDMVDIELSSPLLKQTIVLARRLKKKVIVSSHYFKAMPTNLETVFKKSLSTRADIVKIAAKASGFDDVLTMLNFTRRHSGAGHRQHKHPLITMCLGPQGAISRLILPAAGSLYTYTFLNKPSAPGQIDIATLKSHLKIYLIG